MRKLLLFLLLAVIATACSQEGTSIKQEVGFTSSDVSELKSLGMAIKSNSASIQPIAQKAIIRTRSTNNGIESLTKEEMDVIQGHLKTSGEKTIQILEELGVDLTEMDKALPISSNLDIYGIAGIELMDYVDFSDFQPIDHPGGTVEYQVKVNQQKMASCFYKVLGGDIWDAIREGVWKFAAGYATKEALKAFAKTVIEGAVKKYAALVAGGVITAAMYFAEWICCYFDVPILGFESPLRQKKILLESNKFLIYSNIKSGNYISIKNNILT